MVRPTWDELHQQERLKPKRNSVTAIVTGKWYIDEPFENPPFKVTLSGDSADVEEVLESLKENGNLFDLSVTYESQRKSLFS